MKQENNYRPSHIEFDVATDGTPVPETLGEFMEAHEALVFMQKTYFSTNQALTVNRHMDNFEKNEMRKDYNDIMENLLPKFEQTMRDAIDAYNHAKAKKEEAINMVQASISEAKAIAQEVRRGLKAMQLDEEFTWKLPYKGRFYFFTYIDKAIRLVAVKDMREDEKAELFRQGKLNEDVFDNKTDGTTEVQQARRPGRPKRDK